MSDGRVDKKARKKPKDEKARRRNTGNTASLDPTGVFWRPARPSTKTVREAKQRDLESLKNCDLVMNGLSIKAGR